jgi:hypothetical protein
LADDFRKPLSNLLVVGKTLKRFRFWPNHVECLAGRELVELLTSDRHLNNTSSMIETVINWLRTYEFIAIWLEGIALVAIFVWDRLDSRKQHEETLAQLQVSQKQLEASLEQVEASHKPFVAFSAERRNPEDAILNMGGPSGEWSCGVLGETQK